MEPPRSKGSIVATIGVALLAGVAAFVLLLPIAGVDTDPPECWSMFGYTVPCGFALGMFAGAAVFLLVGLAFWRRSRHRRSQNNGHPD